MSSYSADSDTSFSVKVELAGREKIAIDDLFNAQILLPRSMIFPNYAASFEKDVEQDVIIRCVPFQRDKQQLHEPAVHVICFFSDTSNRTQYCDVSRSFDVRPSFC